eukprot:Em0009g683a
MNIDPTKKPSNQPAGRPPSQEGRVKSAHIGPVPPSPTQARFDRQEVVHEARLRASSAKAIRDKHITSKKVFPRQPLKDPKEHYTTMYAQNFDGKFVPPPEPRPTSPTRRNNPHPSKQFMVWRVPSREIGIPPQALLNGGLEGLDDFSVADSSEFDELGPHNEGDRNQPLKNPVKVQEVTSDVLERTLRSENVTALDQWLREAGPEEQQTVLKMLKTAEEAQVEETIGDIMQPAAAKAVKKWFGSVNEKEREVAVRLFGTIGSRSRSNSEPGGLPPLQPAPPPPRPQSSAARSRRISAPPNQQRYPPAIWHHQSVRDPPPQVYHRASLFGTVRGPASHYSVHPEWPDYHNDFVPS